MSASPTLKNHFRISAQLDPNALLRVLELFALNDVTPHCVQARSVSGTSLTVDLHVAGLDVHKAEVIAAKLNAQVLVRGASVEHIMPVAVAAE